MADPDLPLVRALQSGEEDALNELMLRHKEALHRFIFRCVGNEEDALELTQESFVRVYFNIGKFHPKAKFVTWLYRISLNLCRDHLRSRKHRQSQQTFSLSESPPDDEAVSGWERELPSRDSGPDEDLVTKEMLAAVNQAIEQLPEHLKVALVLTAFEEKSHIEAAAILQTTPKTVETRVYRARKALEKLLSSIAG